MITPRQRPRNLVGNDVSELHAPKLLLKYPSRNNIRYLIQERRNQKLSQERIRVRVKLLSCLQIWNLDRDVVGMALASLQPLTDRDRGVLYHKRVMNDIPRFASFISQHQILITILPRRFLLLVGLNMNYRRNGFSARIGSLVVAFRVVSPRKLSLWLMQLLVFLDVTRMSRSLDSGTVPSFTSEIGICS